MFYVPGMQGCGAAQGGVPMMPCGATGQFMPVPMVPGGQPHMSACPAMVPGGVGLVPQGVAQVSQHAQPAAGAAAGVAESGRPALAWSVLIGALLCDPARPKQRALCARVGNMCRAWFGGASRIDRSGSELAPTSLLVFVLLTAYALRRGARSRSPARSASKRQSFPDDGKKLSTAYKSLGLQWFHRADG